MVENHFPSIGEIDLIEWMQLVLLTDIDCVAPILQHIDDACGDICRSVHHCMETLGHILQFRMFFTLENIGNNVEYLYRSDSFFGHIPNGPEHSRCFQSRANQIETASIIVNLGMFCNLHTIGFVKLWDQSLSAHTCFDGSIAQFYSFLLLYFVFFFCFPTK